MKILQFGRSMIEMLGVLAIIGVLSIGGLLGYRRAVNNHQANVILDDVNRFAFVILENSYSFENNSYFDVDFTKTSDYQMTAHIEQSNQFSIIVMDVPRGVCESLLPKAAVEYKVRVASADSENPLAEGGLYDSTQADLCEDSNNVVLYFGDTDNLNPPADDEIIACESYADCCRGCFCHFTHPSSTEATGNGKGECRALKSFGAQTTTMSDGNTWSRSTEGMNWWSAMDFCDALGENPVNSSSFPGCSVGTACTLTSVNAMADKWKEFTGWLINEGSAGTAAYIFAINRGGTQENMLANSQAKTKTYMHAFCCP